MAGLLLKELKARGLIRRTLIVTPANLTFQWQRELADKFRERFDVIRGDVLRANFGQNPWQERDNSGLWVCGQRLPVREAALLWNGTADAWGNPMLLAVARCRGS